MSTLSFWVDESEKGRILAVGGILVALDHVHDLVKRWREMKESLGLPEGCEVKWNLPQDHETRRALRRNRRSTRNLSEAAMKLIASQDAITCVVVVMVDKRHYSNSNRHIRGKPSVRDFYCEGLRYALQRVAEEVQANCCSGGVVVCDNPGLGRKARRNGRIIRGLQELQKEYAMWYVDGGKLGARPAKASEGICPEPLKALGFHPSLLMGDATYNDLLQMADVVVGAVRDWVDGVRREEADPRVTAQIRSLVPRFRDGDGTGSFWGDGLVLWPTDDFLWQRLRDSLR